MNQVQGLKSAGETRDVTASCEFSVLKETVAEVPCQHLQAPILYACTSVTNDAKEMLLDRLLNGLSNTEGAMAPCLRPCSYRLRSDALGKPLLTLGNSLGPSVSFSRVPGKTWAAMSTVSNLGIDAELSETFNGLYPFHRVFSRDEFDHATKLCSGRLDEAAALLWSAKEAAVKAMGCGFHFFGPDQLLAGEFKPSKEGFFSKIDAGLKVAVWAVYVQSAWISIAWIQ